MEKLTQSIRNQRRPKGHMSTLGINLLHLRNPWVVACWSCILPGFGHILTGSYIKGFILFLWEIIINVEARVNLAIMYSFTGQFDLARNVFHKRWVLLYASVFVYSVWDSYRVSVELNKYSILADRENSPIIPFKIGVLTINYIDKRVPWLAAIWSFFMPGVGELYAHRLPTGFFILIWTIIISYFSRVLEAIQFTFIGDFRNASNITDPQWLLFIPSVLGFAIYDAYVSTVEYNKAFDTEQSKFLRDNYQSSSFEMPI